MDCRGLLLAAAAISPLAATADERSEAIACSRIADVHQRASCYDAIFVPLAATADVAQTDTPDAPALEHRIEQELRFRDRPFSITPHRPNYVLPATYNFSSDFSPYTAGGLLDIGFEDIEIKFQLSMKAPLWSNVLGSRSGLWFGYTQQTYWQLYDDSSSRPFRETNHEPELMLITPIDYDVLGLRARVLTFGLLHESNGRSDPFSRSWNRLYASVVLQRGNMALSFKPWWRIPESAADDDNPNIERYMGQIEIGAAYKYGQQTFAAILLNNLRSENRSGLQLDWSFPLSNRLKGYVQFYSGYGENLIDAPNYNNRIGIGLMLTDWL